RRDPVVPRRRRRLRPGPAQPRQPDRCRAPGRLPPAPLSARRCGRRDPAVARAARRRGDVGHRRRLQHGRRPRPAAPARAGGARAARDAVRGRRARGRRARARRPRQRRRRAPGPGPGAADARHARQGAGQPRRGGARRRRAHRAPGRDRAPVHLHHRHAAGAGGFRAGSGQAGPARAVASRQAAGIDRALPCRRAAARPAPAAVGHADPAAAVRRRPDRDRDGGDARGAGLLGRGDPSADCARRQRAPAHHPRRRPRPDADRCVAARARTGPRPARREARRRTGMTAEAQDRRRALAAIGLALLSGLFFSTTYLFNRAIAVDGGDWAWTASLRYLITLPLLLPLMPWQGGAAPVLRSIAAHPWAWLRFSAIGFVLFYCLLVYAASSVPSCLVAGSFIFTVVADMLCAPLLYRDARRRIPRAALAIGSMIFAGVLALQLGHAQGALDRAGWIALACVLGAAFAFPLGNRLLLLHLEGTGEAL